MTVKGFGPLPCRILVLGEAPGEREELEGRPFVGPSGKVLAKLLRYAGLSARSVRFENVVEFRPPNNRPPTAREIRESDLAVRLAAAKPEMVIACGATACRALGIEGKVSKLHGKAVEKDGRTVVVMYHPAVLLHDGGAEMVGIIKQDWIELKELLRGAKDRGQKPRLQRTRDYHLGTDAQALEYLRGARAFAFDLETTEPVICGAFIPREARILGYAVSRRQASALWIPEFPELLRPLLEDDHVTKVFHNSKFEFEVLLRQGRIRATRFDDTKLMAYVLGYRDTGLKSLARQVLHEEMLELASIKRERPTEEITSDEWLPYAAADADMTLRLYKKFRRELNAG